MSASSGDSHDLESPGEPDFLQGAAFNTSVLLSRYKLHLKNCKGGFPLMEEITRCHTFTKQINRASACNQYSNENFYCKNCL